MSDEAKWLPNIGKLGGEESPALQSMIADFAAFDLAELEPLVRIPTRSGHPFRFDSGH